jgi:hypothetical protein
MICAAEKGGERLWGVSRTNENTPSIGFDRTTGKAAINIHRTSGRGKI